MTIDGVTPTLAETVSLLETVAVLTKITNDIASALDDADVEDPDSDSMASAVRLLAKQRDMFESVAKAIVAERRAAAAMNRSVETSQDTTIVGEYWNAVDSTDESLRLVGMLPVEDTADGAEEDAADDED